MAESNQSILGKSLQTIGLKKDVHKSILKDGEYHHLKNGITSSFEGDIPFVQNAPSNIFCLDFPKNMVVIGSIYIREKNFHVVFLCGENSNKSEIGYFYPETCEYHTRLSETCFNFSLNHPIKGTYKFINCNLIIYFQDGFNRDRRLDLDNPPFVKALNNDGCYENSDVFDCGSINIQNDLTPPIVEVDSVNESGGLYSGAYQFALAYANVNGDEQSSYYSMTNIVPIYEDRFGSFENTEGSNYNKPTDKSITIRFSNIDTKYNHLNIAVVKTVQGSPSYELIATVPSSQREYTYTGKETTKPLSFDKIVGLYPDYYNSKTLTSANNYLIRANLSTQDEGNYQRLANLIELEWIIKSMRADTFEGTYKDPLNTTNTLGYQRDEVVAFGVRFLLSNGKKSAVYHIPGRLAQSFELAEFTKDNYPEEEACDFYEFQQNEDICEELNTRVPYWKVYDTSSITEMKEPSICESDILGYGEFQYWESSDVYPCNTKVWGELSGKNIRHHKFPSASKVYIHNKPYQASNTSAVSAYNNHNLYIYPMGVRLKREMKHYIEVAYNLGYLKKEDLDIISGFEIVRSDRTNNRSVVANGLLYNMKYYFDTNPSTGEVSKIWYPNYPYNDLREDPYLTQDSGVFENELEKTVNVSSSTTFPAGNIDPGASPYDNPFPIPFILGSSFTVSTSFTIKYSVRKTFNKIRYYASFHFYEPDTQEDFVLEAGDEIDYDDSPQLHEKSVFTFHSPDTSFKHPFLGTELRIHALEFGAMKGWFEPVEGHPFFKPAPASDSANYALQFKSTSNYNNYEFTQPGQKRRLLNDQAYLIGGNFVRFPNNTTTINNRFRESSVGLKLTCDIADPSIIDESRYTLSSNGQCGCKAVVEDRILDAKNSFNVDSSCTETHKYISSYYASVKRLIANQYGQVDTVKYISTGKYHDIHGRDEIFGGDTFITRFSLKRKHGFFTIDYINQSAIGVNYENRSNILSAKYYAINEKGGLFGIKEYVIDGKTSRLDCGIMPILNITLATTGVKNGFFYLYSYGVPYFYVESMINTDLRYSGDTIETTWYPKLKNTDISKWTEQINVNINLDNVYNYNFNYSKQNTESALLPQAADFDPDNFCKNSHPRRIIYSKQSSEEESTDNWIINPANNYIDADSNLGAITDVQALDSQKVLVRYENGVQVFNAFDTLQLESTAITVGTGGMFSQRPKSFVETEVGYAGSTSKWAFDNTQFGAFYIDNNRGRIFQVTDMPMEISNYGMFNWFQENLPIKFLEDLKLLENKPNYNKFNIDNPYFGIGFTSVFDNRFNLWFLTKKDYILINKKDVGNLSFDDEGILLYKGETADLNNKKVFKNVGWTLSYSPTYKSWISFHSFLPNYYLGGIESFYTGNIFSESLFKHWDKKSFQKYYDDLYPFEITVTTSDESKVSILRSLEYTLKSQKYVGQNYQDIFEKSVNFNKLIVSTDNQSSGLLNLNFNDKKDPYRMLSYPKINSDSLDILYSKIEGHKYRINQFADLVLDKNNNQPIFFHDENGVDKYVNNINYDKINSMVLKDQKFRNEFFDVTFIQDKESDYKFIFKLLIDKTLNSHR